MVHSVTGIFEREETEQTGKSSHFDYRFRDALIVVFLSEMSVQIFDAHD